MRRVVVLRPEPGASETVRRARERGLDAIAIPLFELEPTAWNAPDPADFDALLLTSANALRFGGQSLEALRSLSVHAVGEATADAARTAGFEITTVGTGGIDELLASLGPGLRLLHLCGEDRRSAAAVRQSITAVPVYRARELPPPDQLKEAAGAVVLVHSPRAGARIAKLLRDRKRVAIAAISAAAAEAVGSGWRQVEAAGQPTDDALLALAAGMCNKPESA